MIPKADVNFGFARRQAYVARSGVMEITYQQTNDII